MLPIDYHGPLTNEHIAGLILKGRLLRPPEGDNELIELARSASVVREREGQRTLSYGVSSYGFDVRLGNEFRYYGGMPDDGSAIDPLNFKEDQLTTKISSDPVFIAPHSYLLAHTLEIFDMPSDVVALCLGKSTYARCGLIVNVTPIEPGFVGQVTLELLNTADRPIKLYPGQGICQFIFFKGLTPSITYADRKGKYQNQMGVTPPRS